MTEPLDCRHPWYSFKAVDDGFQCAGCGTVWPPTAANVVWTKTLEVLEGMDQQLEQLQEALAGHLALPRCESCGTFFPCHTLSPAGIHTPHFRLCRDCLLPSYYSFDELTPAEAEELLDALARWYHRYGAEIQGFPHAEFRPIVASPLQVLDRTDGALTRLPEEE